MYVGDSRFENKTRFYHW